MAGVVKVQTVLMELVDFVQLKTLDNIALEVLTVLVMLGYINTQEDLVVVCLLWVVVVYKVSIKMFVMFIHPLLVELVALGVWVVLEEDITIN